MKTSIDLPDDLYRQVKAKSALEGKTVREVATALFAAYATGEKPMAPDNTPRKLQVRGAADYEAQMAALRESLARAGVTSGLAEQLERDRR